MEEKHSDRSPSQAHRFYAGPGSLREQAKVTEPETPSVAAMEGTAIHFLAAYCLENNIRPEKYPKRVITINQNKTSIDFPVNEDFCYAVNVYIDTIDALLAKHSLTRKALKVESKIQLDEIDKDAKGTVDCSFIAEDTLYVIDLKGGRGVIVSPEENKQCLYYALRPYFDSKMFIDKIVLGIVQPRGKDGEQTKFWETTPERMDTFAVELQDAIRKTRDPKAPLVVGDHCKFCKAMILCPAYQKGIVAQAQRVLPRLDTVFPLITELNPKQIGEALPALYMLKELLQPLEEYAFKLMVGGTEIPGFGLSKTKPHRRWINEEAVVDEFYEQHGNQIMDVKLKSPAQLEKVLGKEVLKEYIEQPEGELKLVLQKDLKERIKRTVEECFKDVELE